MVSSLHEFIKSNIKDGNKDFLIRTTEMAFGVKFSIQNLNQADSKPEEFVLLDEYQTPKFSVIFLEKYVHCE